MIKSLVRLFCVGAFSYLAAFGSRWWLFVLLVVTGVLQDTMASLLTVHHAHIVAITTTLSRVMSGGRDDNE